MFRDASYLPPADWQLGDQIHPVIAEGGADISGEGGRPYWSHQGWALAGSPGMRHSCTKGKIDKTINNMQLTVATKVRLLTLCSLFSSLCLSHTTLCIRFSHSRTHIIRTVHTYFANILQAAEPPAAPR